MESVLETDARERGRLAALHEYDLLDAPAGDELDAVVRVAAMVAGVPTATLNLIDEHRQCQLTTVGFDGADSDRKDSMCAVRFETGDFVYVPDASKDRTYAENPWVTGILADVRFYASAPLITPRGHALGTLCVFDSRPRELSTDQIDRLKDLAVTILALFERRRQARRNLELAAEADRRQQQLEVERQRLDDERTFLQTLLDSLDTGVAACDSEGRLTLFNEALRKIHGADEQPFAAEDWPLVYSLLAEDGRTLLRPDEVPLARAFTGEVIRGEQLVLRHRAGEMHRFLINARPIDTRDGRRLGAVAAMHDITGTYRAELRRRAAHAVAQALSEATSAADAAAAAAAAAAEELGWACAEYWEIEPAQQQVRRSSSWTRPGLNLSPFTGHTDLSFERGEGLAGTVWERGAPVWSSDMVADAAIAGRLGAARDCGLHTAIGLPVRTADGIVGALAFFTDTVLPPDPDILSLLDSITAHVGRYVERRRAEELALALATARRDFDRVIERVDDYVWTIEIIAGGAARSVYASPNGQAVFGGSLPTVDDPAAQLAARVHPADQAAFADFRATISDGRPADVEIRILGYDGVTRWVWTRAVTRHEGERLLIDGICTNVTDRRELAEHREQLLEQRQEQVRRLQELDRLKDQFMAVVVHELRNPIGIITGYAELLTDEPTCADRRELQVIARTASHLQQLVDDLLDLAHLDADHPTVDMAPLGPARLLREAVQAQQVAADAAGVTLVHDIRSQQILYGDARRLRQVIDNLLSNALKYTTAGGTVTLTAREDAGVITITVADDGIGIPDEQYDQLFTRFFRADTAVRRGIKGTGLGLAITKAIVEAHHGTITVCPGTPTGTQVTVKLPLHTAS